MFRKMPRRGFSRARFVKESLAINFFLINTLFNDGDVVTVETLREKGYAPRKLPGGLKILSKGKLEKKVTIEAHAFSKQAQTKLEELGIAFKVVALKEEAK